MSPRSRLIRFTALSALVLACDRQPPTAAPDTPLPNQAALSAATAPGDPLPYLTLEQRGRFERGRGVFQAEFTTANGLGPLFNAVGCANCHEVPVGGGGGNNDPAEGSEDIEVHATALTGGACDDLGNIGGPVFQKQVTPALHDALHIDFEAVPAAATARALRTTPDVFGFGLLDAVPDWVILALADPNDRNGDGISGRPNRTPDGRIGRFGRKAQTATLREFNAGAFVNEIGITSAGEPNEQVIGGRPFPPGVDPTTDPELPAEAFDAADLFVRLLAPPQPLPRGIVETRGFLVFAKIGCAGCHVPALPTGFNRIRALSNRFVFAYTDLLLHDMGPDLADICLGQAQPAEFRTEPLMGLRFATAFLHDGRALTIEDAIRQHGGEATRARDRFLRLTRGERLAMLAFLRGL